MAKGFQQVIVIGNLGRTPEMRYTQSGKTVTSFSLACTTGSGDYEHTEWFNCTAWDKLGEIVNQYCDKGSQVQVVGTLKTEEYEKDGEKKKSVKLNVQGVTLLGGKRVEGDAPDAIPATPTPPRQQTKRNAPVALDEEDLPF